MPFIYGINQFKCVYYIYIYIMCACASKQITSNHMNHMASRIFQPLPSGHQTTAPNKLPGLAKSSAASLGVASSERPDLISNISIKPSMPQL